MSKKRGKTPENTQIAQEIEVRDVALLIPYAKNARTHSEAQVAQLAASIREWGWTTPVLIDESNGIVAGHGRVAAARKLGMEQVPVIVTTGWTDAQKRAYILADNKLAMNAGWDEELLRLELADLEELGYAGELMGFAPDEIGQLEENDSSAVDDEPPLVDETKQLLLVEMDSERELEQLYEEMTQRGFKCKVMN